MNKNITAAYLYGASKMRALSGERGAGMAEYTLLLVLVAVALLGVFGLLATEIDNALDKVIAALQGTPTTP